MNHPHPLASGREHVDQVRDPLDVVELQIGRIVEVDVGLVRRADSQRVGVQPRRVADQYRARAEDDRVLGQWSRRST